jgi:hypothetical protein
MQPIETTQLCVVYILYLTMYINSVKSSYEDPKL